MEWIPQIPEWTFLPRRRQIKQPDPRMMNEVSADEETKHRSRAGK
jgi:hypothetical protein